MSRVRFLVFLGFFLSLVAVRTAQSDTMIFYDHDAQGEGALYANMLLEMAGHFDDRVFEQDVHDYTPGRMAEFDYILYIGISGVPLPHPFLDDAASGDHRILWIGTGIDRLTELAGVASRLGFRFVDWNEGTGADGLLYKGRTLERSGMDLSFNQIEVTGSPEVFSTIVFGNNPEKQYPHFLCGNDLCYLVEIPFDSMMIDDRYFVFADLLHEFFQTNTLGPKRALVRFEDLAPGVTDVKLLRERARMFEKMGIPFSFGVVPIFKDPTGKYFGGQSTEFHFQDDPEFVKTLDYLMWKGGTMVMHGITHQHGDGVSREDWEFTEGLNNVPLPENTESWMRDRIQMGLDEFASQGWRPRIWETPHYSASDGDYSVIAEFFDNCYEQPLVFPLPEGAPPDFTHDLHPMGQRLLFYSSDSPFGMGVLPENLGYISRPEGYTPEDMLRMADRMAIIRDGMPSFFFHSDQVSDEDLMIVIDGLLERGYTFISPEDIVGSDGMDGYDSYPAEDDADDDTEKEDDDSMQDDDAGEEGGGLGVCGC